MTTLDDYKNSWAGKGSVATVVITEHAFQSMIKSAARKNARISFQYFWASFTLQLVVYALLTHVLVKHFGDLLLMVLSVVGILLYIPFTATLMIKFKKLASTMANSRNGETLRDNIFRQQLVLADFLKFKKWYELFLIPTSCAIGSATFFQLYVPGGVSGNINGVLIWFGVSLLSCAWAIVRENKKYFKQPIQRLEKMLGEFDQAE